MASETDPMMPQNLQKLHNESGVSALEVRLAGDIKPDWLPRRVLATFSVH